MSDRTHTSAEAFEALYIRNFARMKRFARQYVIYEEDAENIVHDVYGDLWEKRESLFANSDGFAYLLLSVKNRCIDFLRHKTTSIQVLQNVRSELIYDYRIRMYALEHFNIQSESEEELMGKVRKAIGELPPQCRDIFFKSKIEGKKHREIAQEMSISINTVETQMGIAYKKLRRQLSGLLPLIVLFFGS